MPLPPQRRQCGVMSGGAWLEEWLMGGVARFVRSLCSQSDRLIPKPSLSLATFAAGGATGALIAARQGPLEPIGLEAVQQFSGTDAGP
jgi:hypothetical protein